MFLWGESNEDSSIEQTVP